MTDFRISLPPAAACPIALVPAHNGTLELKDAAVIYAAAPLGAGTGTICHPGDNGVPYKALAFDLR